MGASWMGDIEGWDHWDPWLVEEVIGSAGGAQLQKISAKDRALFSHPKRASEVKEMKDQCQAPPAPLCLLRKSFQMPPDNIFAC